MPKSKLPLRTGDLGPDDYRLEMTKHEMRVGPGIEKSDEVPVSQ
jgi:hypothetical protein